MFGKQIKEISLMELDALDDSTNVKVNVGELKELAKKVDELISTKERLEKEANIVVTGFMNDVICGRKYIHTLEFINNSKYDGLISMDATELRNILNHNQKMSDKITKLSYRLDNCEDEANKQINALRKTNFPNHRYSDADIEYLLKLKV